MHKLLLWQNKDIVREKRKPESLTLLVEGLWIHRGDAVLLPGLDGHPAHVKKDMRVGSDVGAVYHYAFHAVVVSDGLVIDQDLLGADAHGHRIPLIDIAHEHRLQVLLPGGNVHQGALAVD